MGSCLLRRRETSTKSSQYGSHWACSHHAQRAEPTHARTTANYSYSTSRNVPNQPGDNYRPTCCVRSPRLKKKKNIRVNACAYAKETNSCSRDRATYARRQTKVVSQRETTPLAANMTWSNTLNFGANLDYIPATYGSSIAAAAAVFLSVPKKQNVNKKRNK